MKSRGICKRWAILAYLRRHSGPRSSRSSTSDRANGCCSGKPQIKGLFIGDAVFLASYKCRCSIYFQKNRLLRLREKVRYADAPISVSCKRRPASKGQKSNHPRCLSSSSAFAFLAFSPSRKSTSVETADNLYQ